MAEHAGEFRPPSDWTAMRTACHGCRSMGYEMQQEDDGSTRMRSIMIPGDGTVTRMVAGTAETGEMPVVRSCFVCGESETPGWIDGFVPPG